MVTSAAVFATRGHERDRGGAAADHHDALARVIEVLGPELRVDNAASEAVGAGELGRVALGVAVVAAAHQQEAAGEADGIARVGPLRFDRPARLGRGPGRAPDAVAEADAAVDAVLGRRLAHVFQDGRAVGDRLGPAPRLEGIAERVHVGIRADAGVAEQVPGAADQVAGLQDGVAQPRAARLEMAVRADAGQPGANHQDVEVRRRGGRGFQARTRWHIRHRACSLEGGSAGRCRLDPSGPRLQAACAPCCVA